MSGVPARVIGTSRAWTLVLASLLLSPVAALQAPADLGEAAPAPAAEAEPTWTLDDRIVVGYRDAPPAVLGPLAASMGGRLVRIDETLRFAVLDVDPARQRDLLKAAVSVPGVAYAKPDARVEGFFTPNDTRYGEQWGPATMGLHAAWDTTRGNHNVTVAILDTGVDDAHPDLAGNYCTDGPDYPNLDAAPRDDHGHGTHVAGTVAASIHNGLGVAGMADACLMGVKVLDAWGSGTFADVASGIVWAADNGADVISMSLGGCPGCDPGSPVTEAMQHAHAAGVLIVAAAGNAWCSPVSYPAAYPEAIAVAALAPPGTDRASFSSCGEKVELAAAGEDVLSTSLSNGEPLSDPSGYMSLSGTSMATPHVAGIAALVWSQRPALTNDDLRCILAQTATDLSDVGRDPYTGFGRVDAAAAMTGDCVPLPPTAVTLTGRARDQLVDLRWSAATSWGSNLTGYNLYRGASGDPLTLLASLGNVLRYADTNVTNDVNYTYAVAGVNGMGEGNWSAPLTLTPMTPPPFSCDASSDAFGNACVPIDLDFVDIQATGVPLSPADDAMYSVSLPFAFGFYGHNYTSMNVSTNGFINFFDGTSSGCCSPTPIPSTSSVNAFVAAMWADLLPNQDRSMTTQVLGVPGSRMVVVQFTDVGFFAGNEARLTFQYQLHEATGHVEVHYLDADPLGEAVYAAGLEDCAGTDGIQAKYGQEALIGNAVRYVAGSGTPPVCRANQPPVVNILTPEDGETVSGDVLASGTATDDSWDTVEYVVAYWYNDSHGQSIAIGGTTNWSGTFSTTGMSGAYTLVAYAYDGTTYSDPAYIAFQVGNVSNQPPRAAIESPTDGSTVRGHVLVSGIATDAEGDAISHVTLQLDNGPELVADGTASWSIEIDLTNTTPGPHTLRARAYGNGTAGPAHRITVNVTALPNTAPFVTILTPGDGESVGRHVYVSGTAQDADASDRVEAVLVSVDGGREQLAWGNESWSAVVDLLPYGDGTHVVSVRAWDGESFGPVASVTIFVTIPQVDLGIASDDITIERQRIQTDFGDAPNVVNERRTVRVTVRNVGDVHSQGGFVTLWAEGELPGPITSSMHLGLADLPALAPGESATVVFRWDTTRTVGDVQLVATLHSHEDVNGENDQARKETWVRVGGINAGLVA